MFGNQEEVYSFLYGTAKGQDFRHKKKIQQILGTVGCLLGASVLFLLGLDTVKCLSVLGLGLLLIWVLPPVRMKQKCQDLKLAVKMDMPNFLDVLALLLEAGQPLWYGVETASEMGDSEFCFRLRNTLHSGGNMEGSRNPELLLERFSQELRIPEVTSVVAAIVQNSRKGEKELAAVLRVQSAICRQERRVLAEEMGNRASNLMLIPSGMVFVAILIMLMTPALLQLGI